MPGKIPTAGLEFLLSTDEKGGEKAMAHLIGGGIAALLGLIGIIGWWDNFGDFLRGGMPFLLFIGGLIAISTGLKINKEKK